MGKITKTTLYCYEVSIELIYVEKGEKRGHSLTALYCAATDPEAVRFGATWLKNRAKALEWEIGSIKVYPYFIRTPEDDGFITSGSGGTLFEWKCDRPGTLEEYIQSFEYDWHLFQKKEFEKNNPGKKYVARDHAGVLLDFADLS